MEQKDHTQYSSTVDSESLLIAQNNRHNNQAVQTTSQLISCDDHVLWNHDRGDIDLCAHANEDVHETTMPNLLR